MENKAICAECKGECCKRCGCHYSPEDFKEITFDALVAEIDKGHISIDWWDGSPFVEDYSGRPKNGINQAYFLRIKNVGANIIDPSWGGVCSLLTDKGCPLSYENRPKGARKLIPYKGKPCHAEYTKNDAAREWFKYDDILKQLVEHYNNKE